MAPKIIVESGATKSDWRVLGQDGREVKRFLRAGTNVSSMKLAEGIPATKNVMVLEEVPGTTMEQYLIDTRNKSQKIRDRTQHNIAVRGQDNAPHEALDGYNQLAGADISYL